jgi:hypothetical protein
MGLLDHLRLGKTTDKEETKHFTHDVSRSKAKEGYLICLSFVVDINTFILGRNVGISKSKKIDDLKHPNLFRYRHWNTPEDYITLVDVIKGIFGANATIFVQAKSTPVYDTLVDIMERLLTGPYPLSSKRDSFDLLPFFLQVDGPHIDKLSGAIKTIVNNELPAVFSDLTPGSAM